MNLSRVPLSDIADFVNGVAFKPDDWEESGKRILRIQNLTDSTKPFNRTNRVVAKRYEVSPGDLLVSWSATLGVFVWEGPDTALVNQHIFRVVPDHGRIDPRYLKHMLSDALVQMEQHLHGATMKHVNRGEFLATTIPLPPLAEQKRIAGILDATDALRAKRREALAQLDTLLQSTFLDMFGDPVTNSNIPSAIMTELVTKFIDYRGKSPEKSKGGVPLITAKIVKEKEVKEPNEFIPANSYDAWMRRGIPNPGDVVITTEAPMGEVALVPDYKAAFAQRLLVLQPDETKVKSIYLMWALTMPFVIRQLRQRSTGSTVTGIRSREFKKVTLPIPSLDLQRRFAAIVESVEQQKASQRTHMAELDTLFASLQARAFRGHL